MVGPSAFGTGALDAKLRDLIDMSARDIDLGKDIIVEMILTTIANQFEVIPRRLRIVQSSGQLHRNPAVR